MTERRTGQDQTTGLFMIDRNNNQYSVTFQRRLAISTSNVRAFILMSVLILSTVLTIPKAFGSHDDLTIQTDKVTYGPGSTVKIFGTANNADNGQIVKITITPPTGALTTKDLEINVEKYSFDYKLTKSAVEGLYKVKATFSGDTTYTFFRVADSKSDNIVIETDFDKYFPGDEVEISVEVDRVDPEENNITLVIIDPDNKNILSETEEIDEDNSFRLDYDLKSTAIHGRYAIRVEYQDQSAAAIFEIIDEDDDSVNLVSIKTDKSTYSPGATVEISGKVNRVSGEEFVNIMISDPNKKNIVDDDATFAKDGSFVFDYKMRDDALVGKYRIVAAYSGIHKEVSFEVTSSGAPPSALSVKLNKTDYLTEETMKVSGKVDKIIKDKVINILVFKPDGAFVGLGGYTNPNPDLTYNLDIKLSGTLDVKDKYRVEVSYGDNKTATPFNIKGKSGPLPNPITIKTDKTQYNSGSTITISGTVDKNLIIDEQNVIIQINNPKDEVYKIDTVELSSDGSYLYNIVVGGKLGISGKYEVTAIYDLKQAKTTFDVKESGKQDLDLKIDEKEYRIDYEITKGSLKSAFARPEDGRIILSVDDSEAGQLKITLPRQVIDSTQGGKDTKYVVSVVDLETGETNLISSKEVQTTNDERTLVIDYPLGTGLIEIQGTQVIPEFGSITMILVVSMTVIVIAASRFQNAIKGKL